MAEFKYNNGKPIALPVKAAYDQTPISVTLKAVPAEDSIRLGGHSIISCLTFEIEDVTFEDFDLDVAHKLYDQTLKVKTDVTKYKVVDGTGDTTKVPVSCTLLIQAGNDTLAEYALDDAVNPTGHSRYTYLVLFKTA